MRREYRARGRAGRVGDTARWIGRGGVSWTRVARRVRDAVPRAQSGNEWFPRNVVAETDRRGVGGKATASRAGRPGDAPSTPMASLSMPRLWRSGYLCGGDPMVVGSSEVRSLSRRVVIAPSRLRAEGALLNGKNDAAVRAPLVDRRLREGGGGGGQRSIRARRGRSPGSGSSRGARAPSSSSRSVPSVCGDSFLSSPFRSPRWARDSPTSALDPRARSPSAMKIACVSWLRASKATPRPSRLSPPRGVPMRAPLRVIPRSNGEGLFRRSTVTRKSIFTFL